jgi:hypothetical protein
MGVSRDTLYRDQEWVEGGDIDALINHNSRTEKTTNRVDPTF